MGPLTVPLRRGTIGAAEFLGAWSSARSRYTAIVAASSGELSTPPQGNGAQQCHGFCRD